ncbi:hypothetical protein GCM10027612_82180 [Microbispora bryophytorum subsp. camponoti]
MHLTTQRRAAWALVALAVGAFTYVTAEVLPIGLLTVMANDLNRSPSETGLLVTGYAAVVVLASLPLTRLTQRVPRRRLLTVTLGVFVVGMLLTAVAPNYPTLLAARLLVGATQALFWSVATPAAAAMFPRRSGGARSPGCRSAVPSGPSSASRRAPGSASRSAGGPRSPWPPPSA